MHLFSEYIQPITSWLHNHPYWALILTFTVSFAESLALIGSIVPGSVTMTAIGILAGSGIMRIDLTLLASTLGAIAGDGVSYMLGYTLSDRLVNFWPFSRYPHWIKYGEDFFAKHGGKSVLLGRFIGPLRSIIPVIAGMMQMEHWRFYIANILSAIAWSLLYVLPGILIGAASNELSPETATRLFLFILLILGGIWFLSVVLKWMLTRMNNLLRSNLNNLWTIASKHPVFARFIYFITPKVEENYYATASLILLILLISLAFVFLSVLVIQHDWVSGINRAVFLLLQSLRAPSFDLFFIISMQLCSYLTLTVLIFFLVCLAIYYKDKRTFCYWLSLILSCTLLLLFTHWLIYSPAPITFTAVSSSHSFPALKLTYASAIFLAVFLFVYHYGNARSKKTLKLFFPIVLLLAGFSGIYLGDFWFSDMIGAYLAGSNIALVHWLFYRQSLKSKSLYPSSSLLALILLMLVTTFIGCLVNYHKEVKRHQPYFAQYILTDQLWWNQSKPLLPLFRVNRLGQPVNLFNIQYVGSLNHLEASLIAFGWKKQNESLYHAVIKRLERHPKSQPMPLISELYLNRRASLLMTYQPNDGSPMLLLRLWRSNYHLKNHPQPIWIGSVHPRITPKKQVKLPISNNNSLVNPSLFYLRLALSNYLQREIPLPSDRLIRGVTQDVEPKLLLIREKPWIEFFLI